MYGCPIPNHSLVKIMESAPKMLQFLAFHIHTIKLALSFIQGDLWTVLPCLLRIKKTKKKQKAETINSSLQSKVISKTIGFLSREEQSKGS